MIKRKQRNGKENIKLPRNNMALSRPNNKLNYSRNSNYLKVRLEPYEKLQNTRGIFL